MLEAKATEPRVHDGHLPTSARPGRRAGPSPPKPRRLYAATSPSQPSVARREAQRGRLRGAPSGCHGGSPISRGKTRALECTGATSYASTSEPAGQIEVQAVRHSPGGAFRDRRSACAGPVGWPSCGAQYLPVGGSRDARLGQRGRQLFRACSAWCGHALARRRAGRSVAKLRLSPGRVRDWHVRLAGLRCGGCRGDRAQGRRLRLAHLDIAWRPRPQWSDSLFRPPGHWPAQGGRDRGRIDGSGSGRVMRRSNRQDQGVPYRRHCRRA